MKNAFIVMLVSLNGFFLLANGSKALFAYNVSGLTYVGLLLNLMTVAFFMPDIIRMFWRRG